MFRMRIVALLAVICLSIGAKAQSTRGVLLEHFTNASCTSCAMVNDEFNSFVNDHYDSLVILTYHTSWPGVDPMNSNVASVVGARASYYGVSAAPTLVASGEVVESCDGYWTGAPPCYSPADLDVDYAHNNSFTSAGLALYNQLNNELNVNIVVLANGDQTGDFRLRAFIAEKEVNYCTSQGSNGDTHFEHVVRGMLIDLEGEDLPDFIPDGSSQVYEYTTAIPTGFKDLSNMEVIVFIQDDSDKTIKEAIRVDATQDGGKDIAMNQCTTPISQCESTFSLAGVMAENRRVADVNNMVIHATVNGVEAYTGNYTGVLQGGISQPVLSDVAVNLNEGMNEIKVWATDIDGEVDGNSTNDIWTQQVFVYSSIASGGLFESFGNSTNLPANWQVINPSATANTWQYASSSYDAVGGSFMLPLYYIPAGENHELVIERRDLVGTDSIDFTFSLAKGQYYFHYDTLEVHVSNDCGATWSRVWMKGEPTLGTTSPSYSLYASADSADWRNETIAKSVLAPYFPFENMMFKFVCRSDFGNTLFLDNIRINQYGVGVEEISALQSIKVYPNPASQMLSVQIPSGLGKASMVMYDLTGRVVYRDQTNSGGLHMLNLDHLANGVYTLFVALDGKQTSTKVVVQH